MTGSGRTALGHRGHETDERDQQGQNIGSPSLGGDREEVYCWRDDLQACGLHCSLCIDVGGVPALIPPRAGRPRQRQDGCAISLDGDWAIMDQARWAEILHAALYVSVYVMRSRVWNLPSLGMRWRQVGEKFPSTRNGHARERGAGNGKRWGDSWKTALQLVDQSVSRPGPQ